MAKILIVDDNRVNLTMLRAQLNRDNHDLISADSGQSALDIVRENPTFDLILIDVVMPDMDGISVCEQIKANPRTVHIPIVLISAMRTDDESVKRGLERGADGYLAKPVEEVALRAWVKATLRISRLQRELEGRQLASKEGDESLFKVFARLSHSVNNPLQALYAAADMLALELPESSAGRALIADILIQAERVAELVANASLLAKKELPC
ncbi:MAG: response regulator [Candidatus Hydrogenedentes bacterium]|nr:response regulator [Candidatus Hydrogenedentota bacterium]